MNREDIIRMAREQGLPETATEGVFIVNTDDLGRILAAERKAMMQLFTDPENQPTQHGTVTVEYMQREITAEREACEALYAHEDVQVPVGNSAWGEAYQDGWIAGAQAYRDAIRARGQA